MADVECTKMVTACNMFEIFVILAIFIQTLTPVMEVMHHCAARAGDRARTDDLVSHTSLTPVALPQAEKTPRPVAPPHR